jgi:hypothetical protein
MIPLHRRVRAIIKACSRCLHGSLSKRLSGTFRRESVKIVDLGLRYDL